MDERLIQADPALVRQVIARAWLEVPAIETTMGEVRLEPHQVDAASRLLTLLDENGGALLADATGLGKTFVAIAIARTFQAPLIVAPASLRGMWRESLGRTGVSAGLVSYESLSRGDGTGSVRPDLLVLDEAHHARNPRTRRYAELADLAWGPKVMLLTATPIHNRMSDLRSLIALFAGSRALDMNEGELNRLIVRRTAAGTSRRSALPAVGGTEWISVPVDHATARAIEAIPPALPAADGSTAHALVQLGLIRAWCSSEAALGETLRRRLRRAAAYAVALEEGRIPDRRELANWMFVDDAIQPGFPELFSGTAPFDRERILTDIERHADGVRTALRCLERNAGRTDQARVGALTEIRRRHDGIPIVAFSQFADTAAWVFRASVRSGGVVLVSGRGARIASGSIPVDEVLMGFDVSGTEISQRSALPFQLLIATDVLSEGLSLRRAGVLVHIDLPWTVARLEQRVGRLRRLGSPHRDIHVYAIGPPLGARELVRLIRTLQRKARVSSGTVGTSEQDTVLPLAGSRLHRSNGPRTRRGSAECEELTRATFRQWLSGQDTREESSTASATALALVAIGPTLRLLAVKDLQVREGACDILDAVQAVSGGRSDGPDVMPALSDVARVVNEWADQQRGRELARLATDVPSPAHAGVLRWLSERLHRATRGERVSLGNRVARVRELVISARGAGAEVALQALLDGPNALDLDALETLLQSRVTHRTDAAGSVRLVAVLARTPGTNRIAGGLASQTR